MIRVCPLEYCHASIPRVPEPAEYARVAQPTTWPALLIALGELARFVSPVELSKML